MQVSEPPTLLNMLETNDFNMEELKPFRDTDYFVNQKGECFRKGKQLTGHKNQKGYIKIDVWIDGKRDKHYSLHRMVAEVFIPNPKNLPQINHLDGDKQNNSITNLEWCDGFENIKHRIEKLGVGMDQNHKSTKIPSKEIKILRWKKSINYPINIKETAKKWGLRVDYLRKIINGKQRTRV